MIDPSLAVVYSDHNQISNKKHANNIYHLIGKF